MDVNYRDVAVILSVWLALENPVRNDDEWLEAAEAAVRNFYARQDRPT